MMPTTDPTTGKKQRKPRHTYTEEFKLGAVRMVTQQKQKPGAAAKALGIDRTLLVTWIHKLAPDWLPEVGEPSDDPKVLKAQLREALRDNQRLRACVEVLKKATAYFANPNP
jgi:transposase